MSKSNTLETGLLKLIFQNIALLNIGDASGLQPSGVAGSLYLALYTTDPTDSDVGVEATFGGYTRVAVVRSVAGWTVTTDTCENAANITFPTSAGPNETITHFGVRTAMAAGDLLYHGALTFSTLVVATDTIKFNAGDLTITED